MSMLLSISTIIVSLLFLVITLASVSLILYLFFKLPSDIKKSSNTNDINEFRTKLIQSEDVSTFYKKADSIVGSDNDYIYTTNLAHTDILSNISNKINTNSVEIDGTNLTSFSNVMFNQKLTGNYIDVLDELNINGLKINYIDTNLNIGGNAFLNTNGAEFNNLTMSNVDGQSINFQDVFNINNDTISINSLSNNVKIMNEDKLAHSFDSTGTTRHENINVKNCITFDKGFEKNQICKDLDFKTNNVNFDKGVVNVLQNMNISSNINIGNIQMYSEGSNLVLVSNIGEKYIVNINT